MPNDWERQLKVISSQKLSERDKKYYSFYFKMVEKFKQVKPDWNPVSPSPRYWLGFGAGRSDVKLEWIFRDNGRFAVQLYIGNLSRNQDVFDKLQEHKEEIEKELGQLSWEPAEGNQKSCRIALYKKNIRGHNNSFRRRN